MSASDELYRQFSGGCPAFGMAPFWFWNGPLETEEIRRQIGLMAEARLPGFTISGRTPLEVPYLSDAWMEAVRIACEEARRKGISVWIYDEYNCPSGRAGGLVLKSRPHLAQKFLIAREAEYREDFLEELPEEGLLAVFACDRAGDALQGFRNITPAIERSRREGNPPPLRPRTRLMVFTAESSLALAPADRKAETNIDALDPEAVSAFIEITYEAYHRAVREYFGETLVGFFTDEPGSFPAYLDDLPPMRLPWTPGLPAAFERMHGYSLPDKLPVLFLDHPASAGVRQDFGQAITHLFRTAYIDRLHDWCRERGVLLTGHFICETPLRWQIASNGAIMPLLGGLDWPGIDSAGAEVSPSQKRDALVEVKMAASAARQSGKQRVMSEIFSRRGWHQPLSGRKLDQDWESALGINYFVPHALYYTIRGQAKRIKPLTDFYQQPFWKYYGHMAEYFARVGFALSQGERRADILLLMPTDSLQATQRPQDMPWRSDPHRWLSEEFTAISAALTAAHLDHDYGDETLLTESGAVENGILTVGAARYRAVVLPPALSLRGATLDLMTDMVVQGGIVVGVEPLPTLLDGRPAADGLLDTLLADDFLPHIAGESVEEKCDALTTILESVLPPPFRLLDEATGEAACGFYCHRRALDGMDAFFLVHLEENHTLLRFECEGDGRLEEWNPSDGSRKLLLSQPDEGYQAARLRFGPRESRLIVFTRFAPGSPLPDREQDSRRTVLGTVQSDAWKIAPEGPNALALDFCRFAAGDTPGFDKEWIGVWEARDRAAAAARAPDPVTAWVEFDFEVAAPPQALGPVCLCAECLSCCELFVNDAPVPVPSNPPFFVDIGMKCADISAHLLKGRNTILLKLPPDRSFIPEPVFLTGDFGVESAASWEAFDRADYLAPAGWFNPWRADYTTDGSPLLVGGPFRLAQRLASIPSGSWVESGFPFFAGTIAYEALIDLPESAPGERLLLCFDDFRDIARVFLNGEEAGLLLWPPYECDITPYVQPGANTFRIEITNTLRNLFGPHHHKLLGSERYLFIRDGLPALRLIRMETLPIDKIQDVTYNY